MIQVLVHHSLSGELGDPGSSLCICCSLGDGLVNLFGWTCGFAWMDFRTYGYICDIYCDTCDICDGCEIYVMYVWMNVRYM
jgi:hypothetical protein